MIDSKVFDLLNAEAKGVHERAQMRAIVAKSPARGQGSGRVFRK